MLSSLLTDMCLDTINSTTKFSPVISRCNFAGLNGMSLHLQTEKLENITLSWQLSAAQLLRCSSPDLCPQILSCYRRTTPQPAPCPPPRPGLPSLLPPETLPPGARGDGVAPPSHGTLAPGRAGSLCQSQPEPPPLTAGALRPVPVSPGGRGRPAAPSRPPPPHRARRTAPVPGETAGGSGMETYLGLEEFQYMGSKTMDRASAVLHKTITAPQQYFQAEASRLRAAMVAGGTESLPGASATPPCAFPRT